MKGAIAAAVLGFIALGSRAAGAAQARVRERERAAGLLAPLVQLLEAWEARGTHPVVIAPDGGLRTDAALQAQHAADGNSQARTLAETPHGRGAAVDVWPVSFLAYVPTTRGGTAARWASWAEVPPAVRAEFAAFGAFAEELGHTWGGRWSSAAFPNGDQPHVELKNWKSYPFPPSRGVV